MQADRRNGQFRRPRRRMIPILTKLWDGHLWCNKMPKMLYVLHVNSILCRMREKILSDRGEIKM